MNIVTALLVAAIIIIFGESTIERYVGYCRCGMRHWFFIGRVHEPGRMMFAWALLRTGITVLAVYTGWSFTASMWGTVAVLAWIRWVIHERHNTRRAARALGRVVVTAAGRLKVVTHPAPAPA